MKEYKLREGVWEYLISKRECSTLNFVAHFEQQKYTKQGVYRVLRALEKEGRVIRLRNYVAVNLMWIQREIERLGSIVSKPEIYFDSFDSPRTYRINTLEELDQLYGQIFVTLLSSHITNIKFALFYDLHNYTYIHKVPTVNWYVDFIYKKAPKICLLVGSASPLDTLLARSMKNIAVHQIKKRWPYFISVLGDFVIYNHIDKKVWSKVDALFSSTNVGSVKEELLFLSQLKGNYKIVVKKNPQKAREFEGAFKKYFVFPEPF